VYLCVPGGHMFPLEYPEDTALMLRTLMSRWAEEEGSTQPDVVLERAGA
jgi:hypothetical protein